jgi:hypothetical protein
MCAQDIHHALIGFSAYPVLLQLEDVLERRHRNGTCLDRAIHCPIVRFQRDIAAGISRDIDFISLLQHIERRKLNTRFGPQSRDDEFLATLAGL